MEAPEASSVTLASTPVGEGALGFGWPPMEPSPIPRPFVTSSAVLTNQADDFSTLWSMACIGPEAFHCVPSEATRFLNCSSGMLLRMMIWLLGMKSNVELPRPDDFMV